MDSNKISAVRGLEAFGFRVRVLVALAGLVVFGLAVSISAKATCFNTGLRVGQSAGLPDCRAYEQVSPVDKGGFAANAFATPAQVSRSGEGIAYLSNEAFPGALGNTALFAAHVSTRSAVGWKTAEWTPEVAQPSVLKTFLASYAFSDDLSQAVLKVAVVPLTPEATPNTYNLFLRRSDGSYSLINAAKPAVSVEEICGPGLLWLCWQFIDTSAYAGGSSDLTHVIFESNAELTPEAPRESAESLYENTGGQVTLVGILPDGNPAASSTAGAGSSTSNLDGEQEADRRVEHAMSSDGSHVVFQALADGGKPDPAQSGLTEVYDRINGVETLELSAPAPDASPAVDTAEPATFWGASVDGSRVFFTSAAELTTQSNTGTANGGEDLYEYDLEARQLTDLTIDTSPEDVANGAMVQGVVDVSSDGSYVYLVARGLLDPGKGVDGAPNLYMVHDGASPAFIATLNAGGTCSFRVSRSADACDWTSFPAELEAYVAPDGRHMAFMSTMSLPTLSFPSGYNNTDQSTGAPDSEVYEYSAPSGGGEGRLVCASCNPSGAPPIGNALLGGTAESAPVPQPGQTHYESVSTPFYRVHGMSDNGGRLFYTAPASQSALFERVYEFEQDGEGTCQSVGGCQYRLSSGGGESDQFLDASDDGANVFFTTKSQLVVSDSDAVLDVYDARIDGGIPISTGAVCESDCRLSGGTATVQAPASSAVGPSGNLPPTRPLRRAHKKKCDKGHKLRHGKCVKKKSKARKVAGKSNPKRRAR